MTGQQMAAAFIRRINRICRIAVNEKPPFIAVVTKDGVKVLEIGGK